MEVSPQPGFDPGYYGNQGNVQLNVRCEKIIQECAHTIRLC
jgi:hypothetical protein